MSKITSSVFSSKLTLKVQEAKVTLVRGSILRIQSMILSWPWTEFQQHKNRSSSDNHLQIHNWLSYRHNFLFLHMLTETELNHTLSECFSLWEMCPKPLGEKGFQAIDINQQRLKKERNIEQNFKKATVIKNSQQADSKPIYDFFYYYYNYCYYDCYIYISQLTKYVLLTRKTSL